MALLKQLTASLIAALMVLGTAARAAEPGIDFSGVQADLAGEPTQILVLGSPHLSGMKDEIPRADLSLLLDRLEAFAPDVIAVEAPTGEACLLLRALAKQYEGVAERYCADPAPALESLGLSEWEAVAALHTAWAEYTPEMTPPERRAFAALLYAAGEPYTATLQWSLLPPEERTAADGVSEALRDNLTKRMDRANERMSIAAEIARRVGVAQLHSMDDRLADDVLRRSRPELGPVIQSIWEKGREKARPRNEDLAQMLGSPEGVLAYYRAMNSPAYQRLTIDSDFGLAASTPDEDAVARDYLAWWQARGLRMAADVIEAAGNKPGARVLVVVGASHKAYFDAYLDQMHDVALVSVDEVLHD